MKNSFIIPISLFLLFCSLVSFKLASEHTNIKDLSSIISLDKFSFQAATHLDEHSFNTNFDRSESLMNCPEIGRTRIQKNGNNHLGDTIDMQVCGFNFPIGEMVKWYISPDSNFNPANGEGIYIGEKAIVPNFNINDRVSFAALLMDACNVGNNEEIQNEFIAYDIIQPINLSSSCFFFDDIVKDGQPENSDIDGINCTFQKPNNAAEIQNNTPCQVNFVDSNNGEIPANSLLIILTSTNTDWNYDFSKACDLGLNLYITQNSCDRTIEAFPNNTSNLRLTYYFKRSIYIQPFSYSGRISNEQNSTALIFSCGDNLSFDITEGCNPNFSFLKTVGSELLLYAPPSTLCEGVYHIKGYFKSTIEGCEEIYFTDSEPFYFNNPNVQNESFDFFVDRTICQGETYLLGDQTLSESGNYKAILYKSNGCDSIVTLNLEVENCGKIESECRKEAINNIPKSFAPNSTIINNQTFHPIATFDDLGCQLEITSTQTQLTIFNRWGNIIYQPRPYEPWNGKINGNQEEAPPTTYYYTLAIGEEIIKGSINLIQVE